MEKNDRHNQGDNSDTLGAQELAARLENPYRSFLTGKSTDSFARMGGTVALLSLALLYARPQDILSPIGAVRLPLMIAVLAGILWSTRMSSGWTKGTRLMFLFLLVEGFRGVIGKVVFDNFVVNDAHSFNTWNDLLLQFLGTLFPLAVFCSNGSALRRFYRWWLSIAIFISAWIITHGGIGPGGFLSDENDAGLVALMLLPYSLAIANESRSGAHKGKLAALVVSGLIVIAVIRTASRGAFLGLVAVAAYFFWRSKKKMKLLIMSGVIALAIVPFIPSTYIKEIRSISDTTGGTAGIRRHYWTLATRVFLDPKNTLLGVGLGNTAFNMTEYETADDLAKFPSAAGRATHSLYFQVLPDLGLWGVFLYGSVGLYCFRINRMNIKRLERIVSDLKIWQTMTRTVEQKSQQLQNLNKTREVELELEYVRPFLIANSVAMVAILSSGAFISVAYYPPFWTVTALTAMTEIYLRKLFTPAEEMAAVLNGRKWPPTQLSNNKV